MVIKNYWGMADNDVTLQAQATVHEPLVAWDVSTVNYGGVGSFNEDDNGLIYDEIRARCLSDFRWRKTLKSCPMLVTANNGLDPDDRMYT